MSVLVDRELTWKLKIKSNLFEFASLSSHEVLTERSEGKAQSRIMMCLRNYCDLSVGEVPAMQKLKIKARSRAIARLHNHCSTLYFNRIFNL